MIFNSPLSDATVRPRVTQSCLIFSWMSAARVSSVLATVDELRGDFLRASLIFPRSIDAVNTAISVLESNGSGVDTTKPPKLSLVSLGLGLDC